MLLVNSTVFIKLFPEPSISPFTKKASRAITSPATKTNAIVFAVTLAGAPAIARAQAQSPSAKTSVTTRDSVSIADVQRAADELARSVQAVVKKVTEDPQLKIAALNLAKESVNAAQVVVNQQAETLQSVLETLSKEVAAASESIQKSKPKTH